MLVLSRKAGQSLYIDDIKVTVVKLDRNRVKIGIEAPSHVQVMREEIVEAAKFAETDGKLEFELPVSSVDSPLPSP